MFGELVDRGPCGASDQCVGVFGDALFRRIVQVFGRPCDRVEVPAGDLTVGEGLVEAGDLVAGAGALARSADLARIGLC